MVCKQKLLLLKIDLNRTATGILFINKYIVHMIWHSSPEVRVGKKHVISVFRISPFKKCPFMDHA